MPNPVQEQFTTRVPIYDRRSAWILDPGILRTMVEACDAPEDARLLDVCCGTGAVGEAFAGRVARREGLDLTPAMLEKARTRLDAVHQGSAYALPFEDASFDLAVSRQALHFFDRPARVIEEMARILKPGGQIILGQRVPYGDVDAAFMEEINRLKQPQIRTFMRVEHLSYGLTRGGLSNPQWREYHLWESIQDWVDSPEIPEENKEVIVSLYRNSPAEIRAVHPVEVTPSGEVRAKWRWVVVSAHKPL